MSRLVPAIAIALVLILTPPSPATAPVIFPVEVLQEHQYPEPEPEPETIIFEATAYTWTGNQTATGTWPEVGRTIAVDPDIIPYGSEVIVDGHAYIAEDTRGDIRGNRIDIYMGSGSDAYKEAMQFGRQWVEVQIKGGILNDVN